MARFPSDIEYAESGDGRAILFVPGSFGTSAGWKRVISALDGRYRCVSTSLLGYGATAERRPPGNTSTELQNDALDSIFERIAAPVHVVAHSFGGNSVLAHALYGKCSAVSLTLIEANPLCILQAVGEVALYRMFSDLTEVYYAEFHSGRADAARHVIDFYGGTGAFAALPSRVRDYVMATTPVNIRDWATAMAFAPTLSEYGTIKVPTLVVRGGNSHPAMIRIAELLTEHLPDARLQTISGGGHFLPATHPVELARLISQQVGST